MKNVFSGVIEAFDKIGTPVEVQEIKEGDRIRNDLGLDSMDFMEFLIALEDVFDLDISDEEAAEFKKVGDVVKWANSKI